MKVVHQPISRGGVSTGVIKNDNLPEGMRSLDMWVGPSSLSYKGQVSSQSDHIITGAPKVDWAKRLVTITIDCKGPEGGVGLTAIGDFSGTVPLPMLIGKGKFTVQLTNTQGTVLREARFDN